MNLQKIQNLLDEVFSSIGVACFILLTAVAFIQIIARYVFSNTLLWPEETCRFTFIWMAYMGMASCWTNNSHLKVDIIYLITRRKVKNVVYTINAMISIFFSMFVVKLGMEMIGMVIESEQQALTIPIPLVYIWLAIPLAFLLSAIQAAINILKIFVAGEQVEEGTQVNI